jgi:sulfur carrier protein
LKHASVEAIIAREVGQLRFTFNGFPEEIEGSELVVQDLLDRTNEDDPAVIVELNGRFIYRKDFKSAKISEGDRVEFIHPSFGG